MTLRGSETGFPMTSALKIGMVLGTRNLLACVGGKSQVVSEPSIMAVDSQSARVLAVGRQARELVGRVPSHVRLSYPFHGGRVGDLEDARRLVRQLMRTALGWRWRLRPEVVLSFPVGTSSYEKRSLIEAVMAAGAGKVRLVPHPLAAAKGAGLPVSEPRGSVVVDLGASHTEIALISMGGVVSSTVVPVGGDDLDAAILRYLAAQHQLEVSPEVAEDLKLRVGSAHSSQAAKSAEALGRDLETGLPRRFLVRPEMAREALARPLNEIARGVMLTLEHTPPALADDIVEHGLVLTGGGAELPGMSEFLKDLTRLPVRVAEAPTVCAAAGALELHQS